MAGATDISTLPFLEYALSPDRSEDEIYVIELLIDKSRSDWDKNYWKNWEVHDKRSDELESPDYQPRIERKLLNKAVKTLVRMHWVNLQNWKKESRPVRDITPLQFLPKLAGLFLSGNEVEDLSPLRHCTELRRIGLTETPIRDLSPLLSCPKLDDVALGRNPHLTDLSPLEGLPNLTDLNLSEDTVALLPTVKCLPALERLDASASDTLEGWPEMPKVREMRSLSPKSLQGIEKYPSLENLTNLDGEFESLEPLRSLKNLTHMNTWGRVTSLEPLADTLRLRSLFLKTEAKSLDLAPLERLPALHDVTIRLGNDEHPELEKLRASLSSWDVELRCPPRYTPSLELEIVDQDTFDYYDTKVPHGLEGWDGNLGMLSSELEWLDKRLEQVFEVDFTEGEDFELPFRWGQARSRTVFVMGEEVIEAFPRLVLGMQAVLAECRYDWILYFEADSDDFVVWVYPEKIVTTKQYQKAVRKLIRNF